MRLEALTRNNCELVRQWRNLDITAYRTPYMMTEEMQSSFYDDVICNRNSDSRYFAVIDEAVNKGSEQEFVAMVGLVTISPENRSAELSIVVRPEHRLKGIGTKALKLLLQHGFMSMNLEHIYGECYECSPSFSWWIKIIKADKFMTYSTLPCRKFHNGMYHNSIYFDFNRGAIYNDDI